MRRDDSSNIPLRWCRKDVVTHDDEITVGKIVMLFALIMMITLIVIL